MRPVTREDVDMKFMELQRRCLNLLQQFHDETGMKPNMQIAQTDCGPRVLLASVSVPVAIYRPDDPGPAQRDISQADAYQAPF
jgi:hypothetical protein